MLLTMFLLVVVYIVLIGALFAVGASGVTILVVALGLLAVQLFTSDKIAMGTMGVKEVSPPRSPSCTASSSGSACRPTCPSRASA